MSTLKKQPRTEPAVVEESFPRVAWLYIKSMGNSSYGKVLFVRSPEGKAFIIPGARLPEGACPTRVLEDKIQLDLNVRLDRQTIQLYKSFQAPAFGKEEGVMVENKFYISNCFGTPMCTPQIYELAYLGYDDPRIQTDIDRSIMEMLFKEGIIE